MDIIQRRFDARALLSTPSQSWSAVIAGWILALGCLGFSSAEAQDMYVDQVVPSQVNVGQVFTIEGQFPGMTSAAAFLSDGIYGLPLTVLSVTNDQILARIDAIPWPMTGTLHVMNQEGIQQIPNQTWQGGGVSLNVTGGVQFESTQAVSGGVLTVVGGAPVLPPQVFAAVGGGLSLDPNGPCSGTTALILIEPDLGSQELEVDPSGCKGWGLEVFIGCENGVNMPVANFYSTLAVGLNQLVTNLSQVTYDPNNGSSGNGTLFIEHPELCPTVDGAAALIHP